MSGLTIAQRLERYSIPEPNSGCQLWLGDARSGYGRLKVGGRMRSAHRLAWQLSNGDIPAGMNVLHKCDVPACINPDHLFLGTQIDNIVDMVAKGRQSRSGAPPGEGHPCVKLNESQVRAIREDRRRLRTIAAEYGVSFGTIWAVRSGKRWKHIL